MSGRAITVESLKAGIETVNNKRAAMHRLAKLRHANPAPISGLDALLANQVFFYDDPERFTDSVNKLCDELEQRIEKKIGVAPDTTPRIVISGCPMAVPNWKLPSIIESAGAVVVGEESCIGERGTQNLVSTDGESVEALIENLVDRYFTIDCAVFTPNPTRAEHALQIARDAKADGVIHYALQFCSPVSDGSAAARAPRGRRRPAGAAHRHRLQPGGRGPAAHARGGLHRADQALAGADAMRVIGLDIGSRTVKRVTVEDGEVTDHLVVPNNHDPLAVCDELLSGQRGRPGGGHGLRPAPLRRAPRGRDADRDPGGGAGREASVPAAPGRCWTSAVRTPR